jgi:serine/threonine protein kinase
LFGVKGRSGAKIHSKQLEVSKSIPKLMEESLILDIYQRKLLSDLLSQMLDLNYKTRISPMDALNHPFFSQ